MSDMPRKHDLLQRIDETWSDWLQAINQVDGSRVNEGGVCGYWSVKDVAAHLAYWEGVVLEHIERDRLKLGPRDIDVDAINQQIYLENRERDWALVKIDLHRAHALTVVAVNALPDEPSKALDSRIGDETWNHYPEHTAQVREWLAGPAKGDEMTPAQISAKYERAVSDGLALLQRIPEERRQEPGVCGIWSAKDLLGHLAFWDGYRLSRIDAEMAGNPIPVIDDEAPYDRTNSEQAALRSSWSWEMAFDEFTSIRDRLIEALRAPSQYDQRSAGNHWDLHRADIERWLAGNPGPE